jgi:hypothetical protein
MPNDNNQNSINPSAPPVQPGQNTTQTTPPVIDSSTDTPPPPIIISEEEAKEKPEVPPKMTASPTIDIPPVVVTGNEARKYSLISKMGGKRVITILGILLLVGGVGVGVYLTKQSQDIREKASEGICSEDSVSSCIMQHFGNSCGKGTCKATKNIGKDGSPICECYISSAPPVPTGLPITIENKCNSIKAYKVTGDPASSSSTWTEIPSSEMKNLKEGDVVYFVAKAVYPSPNGSADANSPMIDEAIFTINNIEQSGALSKAPVCGSSNTCTVEFYQKYTIPAGKYDFNVSAKLHITGADIWF